MITIATRKTSRWSLPFIEPLEQRIAPATFAVTTTADTGAGSLRQAIIDANAAANSGAPDVITFNISSGFIITPSSLLPEITEAVIIDGYTQPGSAVNTATVGANANIVVGLSGAGLASGNGLVLGGAGGSIVRGLAVFGFGNGINDSGNAILIKSDNNRVEGNFLGLDQAGTATVATKNGNSGVRVGQFTATTETFTGNVIGGPAVADRNVISNNSIGVTTEIEAQGTLIINNLIGTDSDGSGALPNTNAGVIAGGGNTLVGDGTAAGRNVISGNDVRGVLIGVAAGVQVRGNYIGLRASGTGMLPNGDVGILAQNDSRSGVIEGNFIAGNGGDGIQLGSPVSDGGAFNFTVRGNKIGLLTDGSPAPNSGSGVAFYSGAADNLIGGFTMVEGNEIAFNALAGISFGEANGANRFLGNSIHDNSGLGIDIGSQLPGGNYFGVNANDPGDTDGITNFPVIGTFSNNGATQNLVGSYSGAPNTTYRLEFFAMAPSQIDLSGHGEGMVFLGFQDVTTNGSGIASFNFNSNVSLPTNSAFAATATGNGRTSEFGPARGNSVTYTWAGSTDGDWFRAGNWSPVGVPGPLDIAIYGGAGSALNLTAPVSVKQLQQTGGALGGTAASELNVLTTFSWTGGSHTGGTLRLIEGSTGGLGAAGALLWSDGALEVRGSLTVSNGGLNFNRGDLRVEETGFLQLNAGITDADGGTTVVTASNFGTIEKFFTGAFGLANINLVNSGTVVSRNGGNFTVGGITQFDGAIELAISDFTSATPMTISGGVLRGNGTVTGNATFDNGTLVPGFDGDAGTLTFVNSLTFAANGKMKVDIGGTSAGQSDKVVVNGNLALGGSLEHKLINGYVVKTADVFNIIDGTAHNGAFANVSGTRPLSIQYSAGDVTLFATGFTVTNTNDSGAGSLRQAILDANAQPGLDTISFNIPGGGLKTIAPLTVLPALNDDTVLDGYTQPGAAVNMLALGSNATLLIELSGQNVPNVAGQENGILISSGTSYVSGLIINRWNSYGVFVQSGGGGSTIVGNWVGPSATGTSVGANNQFGVLIDGADGVRIGTAAPRDRNVISGNDGNGIEILTGSNGTVIRGNYIGTNPGGNAMLGNGFDGVYTQGGGTIIGGVNAGEGNVISASLNSVGILVNLASASASVVQGNLIGTDATGMLDFGNADIGISVLGAANVLIGGNTPGARNIVAGNGFAGITIEGTGSTGTTVLGNYIGTNAAGTAAIGNDSGILVGFGAVGTIIGSGSDGNVVSGNVGIGIEISGATTSGTQIVGNLIGVSAGQTPLGNGSDGVFVNAATQNQIGFVGAGNIIANNNGAGVNVSVGSGTTISGNSIFSNAGIGIDLGGNGVTANDTGDADTGPNNLLNFPVLSTFNGGASPTVTGTYAGLPNTTLALEFFASVVGSAALAEGGQFIGSVVIATDGAGNATFTVPVSPNLSVGSFITATASSDATTGTSEFSAALATVTAQTFIWDNDDGDNDWFNPDNWNLNSGVPGPFDTAILNIASTINLTAPVVVATFTQTNGIVTGGGTMTVNSSFTWNAGTQSGVGTLFIVPGATAAITGGAAKTLDRRFIENNGTLTVDGSGAFNIQGGAVITNRGVWDFASDADIRQNDAIGSLFKNEAGATLRKTVGVGGGATIIGQGNQSLAFDNKGAIEVVAGNLTIFGSGGTWTGSTSLNISATSLLNFTGGTFTWDGGPSLTGGGTLEIGGTANVSLGAGTTLNVPGGFTLAQTSGVFGGAGTVLVGGVWSWSGGTHGGSGTTSIISTGTLTLGGSGSKVLDTRTLNTGGSVTITGTGDLQLTGAVSITNSSTWSFQTDADINSADAAPKTFTNNGIIRKSGGTADTILSEGSSSLQIDSSFGSLDVLAGTLSINGGGAFTNASGINIATGATLRFSGGSTTLDGNPTLSGGGLFFIDGGGTFSLNAGTTFAPPAATPLSLTGTLTGAGDMIVSGALAWQNGTMSGTGTTTFTSAAAVTMDSIFDLVLAQRTLNNQGNMVWRNLGGFVLDNGAVFNNSGLLDLQSNAAFESGDNTAKAFNNLSAGTFRKSILTGQSTSFASSAIVFNNDGLVDVQTGILNIGLASAWSGTASAVVAGGAQLTFSGALSITGTVTHSGAGTTNLAVFSTTTIGTGGVFNVVAGHTMTAAVSSTLTGAGTLNVGGVLSINGGAQSGTGVTNILPGGIMNLAGSSDLDTRTLNSDGTVTHSNGNLRLLNGATINNNDLWDLTGDVNFTATSGGGTFNIFSPFGALLKSGGTGTSSFAAPNVVSSEGEIGVLSGTLVFNNGFTQDGLGGRLILAGGNVSGTTLTFNDGVLNGFGTIAANVINNGAIVEIGGDEGIGTIAITGNYTQGSGAVMEFEANGPGAVNADKLTVSGTATLGGTLSVEFLTYTPSLGALFEVVSAGTRVGTFSNVVGAGPLTTNYTATSAQLVRNAATFIWDGSSSSDWFTGANWDLGMVPTAGDTAILNIASTINLPSNASVGTFQQSAGTFVSPLGTTFTVNTNFTWTGGVQSGGGTTALGAGSSSTLSGALTLDGRVLSNSGTTTQSGVTSLTLTNAATISNSAAWLIDGDGDLLSGTGANVFALGVGGVLQKTSGTGVSDLQIALNHTDGTGTTTDIAVLSGTVRLAGGGTWDGTDPDVSAGAALEIAGGTLSITNRQVYVNGAGTVRLNGGTLNLLDDQFVTDAATNFEFSSGMLMNQNGHDLVVFGPATWSGGDVIGASTSGGIQFYGNLAITGAANRSVKGQVFDFAGGVTTFSMTGNINLVDDSGFSSRGVMNITGGGGFTHSGSAGAFFAHIGNGTTTGILRKNDASTTSFGSGVEFSASGRLELNAGTLNFVESSFLLGTTVLQGGSLSATGVIELTSAAGVGNEGILRGVGTITGNLLNTSGTVHPGGTGAAGAISITGNYTQGTGGSLEVEFAGAGNGQYDVLSVSGTASLAGVLGITNILGFAPSVGDSFRVVQSGGNPGTFGVLAGNIAGIAQAPDATGLVLQRNVAVFTWDAGAGGDQSWFNPLNWSDDTVPTGGDGAVIAQPVTVTLGADTAVGSLAFSSGTLTGGGRLSVTDSFAWTGGTIATPLTTGGLSVNTITNAAAKTLSGATMTLAGFTTMDATVSLANSAVLENSGAFEIANGADVLGSGTFHHLIGAAGQLTKSGADATDIAVSFLNGSGLIVSEGNFRMTGGGNWGANVSAIMATNSSIEFGGGTHTFSGGNVFTGTAAKVSLTAGVMSFGGASSLVSSDTTLEQTGGMLGGTANLNFSGDLRWRGGTQTGTGSTVILGGGSALLESAGQKFLERNLSIGSGANFVTSGEGTMFFNNSGVLTVGGSLDLNSDHAFDASGNANALINVLATGSIQRNVPGTVSIAVPVTNAGSLVVGDGVVEFSQGFTQSAGSTLLSGGDLTFLQTAVFQGGELRGSGTITGSVNNSGATLRPGALTITGNYTQDAVATLEAEFSGSGAGQFDTVNIGGIATLSGTLRLENVGAFAPQVGTTFRIITSSNTPTAFPSLTGETLGAVQQPDATGLVVAINAVTFTWDDDGGDADWFNPLNWDIDTAVPRAGDAVVLNTAANIVLNSAANVSTYSQTAGSLAGTGTLTVTNGFTWSGGVIGTSVATGASSTNSIGGAGSTTTFNGSLLELGGSTTLSGNADVSTGLGAEIRNVGAFTFTESAGIGGSGLFSNQAGSAGITVSASGTIFIGTNFVGDGPLSVTGGSVDFEGNSTWAVGVAPQISSGAEIQFSAGTHNFLGANSFTGSGTTRQTSGILNFEGTSFSVAVGQAFIQSGGNLGGTAELVVDGTFTWTAGNQSGTSTTRVSSTGTLLVTGAGSKGLDQRDLRVDEGGLLSVSGDGAIAFQDDVLLEVAGELNVSSGAQFSSSGALSQISILSSGSFIKTGSISNVIDVRFLNAGATAIVEGIMNFTGAFEQTAGYTALAGGGLSFTSPAEFSGGLLEGNGSIAGTINNTGAVVSPGNSPGRFTIEGDYIQGPGGFLLIEIEGILPATGYDQIQVTGNASLDGELDVTISGIVPSPGQVFTAISAGSVSGSFASIVLPEPLQARVGAAAVELISPFLPPGLVNLSSFTGRNGAFIPGLSSGDTGLSVAGLGSINGDSFGDFAIGGPFAGNGGETYVVFGKTASFGRDFDLASLDGTEGFKIIGGEGGDRSGFSVSSPGDVNGDGIRDILIGDPNYDGAFANSGAAFIVYGRSSAYPAVIDLSTLDGTDGFRMDIDAASVFAGTSVSGAGDVNGDGVNDIIIGVPDSNIVAADAGAAFVVFGRAATATPFPASFTLSSLSGADGFAITGSFAGDRFGTAVGGAGDLNDDGFDDLVIGAPAFNGVSGADSGAAYVVFGKSSGFSATLDAGTLNGKSGFRMEGRAGAERLGIRVSAAGDMNADGIGDLLIAGRFAFEPVTDDNVGVAYVVFGKTKGYTAIQDLAKLNGANGFRIFTEEKSSTAIVSVSSVGDFNGDGFDDIAVGSPGTGGDAGVTYLMFGRSGGFAPDLSLSTLNATTGFRFRGEVVPDQSGASVSATDVNGDGRADLIIGAPQPGDEGNTAGNGGAYVIYGVATQEIPEVATNGTTITFDDVDGDIISIKATGGKVTADMLVFGPGGVLQLVDLTVANTLRDGANITFSVRKNGGDGALNVGAIDATGIQLGTVKITGDLGQIDVGRGDALKPALKQLIVGSLGALGDSTQIPGTEDPLFSEIRGALPKLIVRGAFTNAVFDVLGRLGSATIGGEFSGTGAFTASQFGGLAALGRDVTSQVAGGNTLASSGLSAGSIGALNIKKSLTNSAVTSGGGISSATVGGSINKGALVAAGAIRVVKVFGAITSDDPAVPSVVAALASPPSSKPAAAIAINSLVVRGSVLNAEILLGYNQSFEPVNGDASAGKVNIKGSFTASSLVAGVKDDTSDGFGRNDVRIGFPAEDPTPKIFSRIASLIISGAAEGSDVAGDSFGITAQQIKSAKINGVKVVLNKALNDDILIGTKGDFRLVEVI